MGWWSDRALPHLVDRSLSTGPVMSRRAVTCSGLTGRVLEIGYGSGLNTAYYPAAVVAVHAVEPSDVAWRLSRARRERSAVPVERVGLDGERLAADDGSYDAVLSTFTLCSIPDIAAALAEVRRVLRPGGALHLLEHGLSPSARVAAWQRRLEPLQRRVAGGCHLTRDPVALTADQGLEPVEVESGYLPGPGVSRPWTYVTRARLTR